MNTIEEPNRASKGQCALDRGNHQRFSEGERQFHPEHGLAIPSNTIEDRRQPQRKRIGWYRRKGYPQTVASAWVGTGVMGVQVTPSMRGKRRKQTGWTRGEFATKPPQ